MPTNQAGSQGSIGNWDSTTLTRFIRDILINQPVQQLPSLTVDSLYVKKMLRSYDQSIFETQRNIHYIGQVAQPAFLNAWVNNGGGYDNAGFVRTVDEWIRLVGVIKLGVVGSPAFVLPPGFRPTSLKTLPVISNNAIGRVDIDVAGNVTPQLPSNNAYVVLDGLAFKGAINTA